MTAFCISSKGLLMAAGGRQPGPPSIWVPGSR
jgi:hypothetical protein